MTNASNAFYITRGTLQALNTDISRALFDIQTTSGNTTLTDAHNYIRCSTTSTLTLPSAVNRDGQIFVFFKTDSAATTITIACSGGQTINGHATITFTPQYYVFMVISNGANWDCVQNGQQLA